MPRVTFVKKARKDNPVCKAGESYYWWQFAYSGKSYSLTRPKRSQLTRSGFYAQMWDLEDDVIANASGESVGDLEGIRDEIAEAVRNMLDEAQDSLEAIPEALQESHMLYERVEELESFVDEVEGVQFEEFDAGNWDRENFEDVDTARESHWDEQAAQLSELGYQGS